MCRLRTMTEHRSRVLSFIGQQLSADPPNYASTSILLGLFEAAHTAKQPLEPSASLQVR